MLKNIIYIKETAYHSGCNHLQNQSHSHLNNKPLYTHICLLHQTLSKEDELKTFYIKNLSCDKEDLLRYVSSACLEALIFLRDFRVLDQIC